MTMQKIDNQTLQLALFALVALAMVVQAVVLLAAFLAMRKAAQIMNEKIDEMRTSVHPLIETSSKLIETSSKLFVKLAPRIDSASEDITVITRTFRAQSAEIQAATSEIAARARAQAGRVDGMLSTALDTVDRAGIMVADAIQKPVRQISALLASVKAVVESLRSSGPASRSRTNHAAGDDDMFV
jgi:hypothetical protein